MVLTGLCLNWDAVRKIKLKSSRNSWVAFSIPLLQLQCMSGLSLRLTEIRSFLLPVSQLVAWPIFFLLTSAISQEPAYFLALLVVLAADVIDKSPRNRGLFRDLVAGGATTLLALFLNDIDGVAIGAIVTVAATSRLVQKQN